MSHPVASQETPPPAVQAAPPPGGREGPSGPPEERGHASLGEIVRSLRALRDHAVLTEHKLAEEIATADPDGRPSARNLAHYLALRQHDLRDLQASLARLGLSSLGRSEPHVLASILAVLSAAERLAGSVSGPACAAPVDHASGPARLARCAERLLGPAPDGRDVRIMVTMPPEASTDPSVTRSLLEAGMDVMRVNCAHDDPAAWGGMVENLARARAATGRACRVLFDLAGPKIRTGPIPAGSRAIHVRPSRDARGVDTAPARLWITASEGPAPAPAEAAADVVLGVDAGTLAACRPGDQLRIVDTRGRRRKIRVASSLADGGVRASLRRGTWVEPGLPFEHRRDGREITRGHVTLPPSGEGSVMIRAGDRVRLVPPGRPGAASSDRAPACVPCTCAEAIRDARGGERVFFDDGKAGGVIDAAAPEGLLVRITSAPAEGLRLRPDKGINFPDTVIDTPALTPKDLADLAHAIRLADMVGLSFVREPGDVAALVRELDARGAPGMGIVLKVETQAAFERLPRILLAALRSPPVGVMVARGDLAVECGFERLAELQEEILWLCEAAHVPVIWATQVLEGLAKTGQPSRAEVTDAAMGGRAECVMLNKGPHAAVAVRFLDDVLRRMRAHQQKKRSMLRRLSVSSLEAHAAAHARGGHGRTTWTS